MLVLPHGSALGGCWGGLCLLPARTSSLPERARRPLPGLSPSGKVFRQVPVHRPPDDHASSCRALSSGRPAGNALLPPVCTHATHACARTAHLRRQRCTLTGTRLPPPLPGSSSQTSGHLLSQPPHLTSLFNCFWPRWVFLATRAPRCGASLVGERRLCSVASVAVVHRPGGCTAHEICPAQGLSPCPGPWQADSQPLGHRGRPPSYLFVWGLPPQLGFVRGLVFTCFIHSWGPTSEDVPLTQWEQKRPSLSSQTSRFWRLLPELVSPRRSS